MSDEVAWRYHSAPLHTLLPAVWQTDRIATDDCDTYPQTVLSWRTVLFSTIKLFEVHVLVSFKIHSRIDYIMSRLPICRVSLKLKRQKAASGANRASSLISNQFDFSGKFDGSGWRTNTRTNYVMSHAVSFVRPKPTQTAHVLRGNLLQLNDRNQRTRGRSDLFQFGGEFASSDGGRHA